MLGKPLIAWTIDTALKASAQRRGRVVVSTDDDRIAQVAREHGAEVPFMRPAELAQDGSTSIDVVIHALDELRESGDTFDLICLLEATSPLRDPADVVAAMDALIARPDAESIVGMAKCVAGHPAFLVKKNAAGLLSPFLGESFRTVRRQDVDEVFFFEGSLYIARTPSIQDRNSFYHDRTLGHVMEDWKSFEIDDLKDFLIVERLLQARLDGTFTA